MRTDEMGNQSTSGILEEEKAVIEAPEEGSFDAGGEDKEKEGENGVIPGDQTEKLPYSNDASDVADTSDEMHEMDEKSQESEESEPVASMESDESANQEEYSEKANGELQIQEQHSIIREKDEEPDERNSSNSVAESVQDSIPDDDSTTESEEPQHLESAEAEKPSDSSQMQMDIEGEDHMDTENKTVDLVPDQEPILVQEKPLESNRMEEIFEDFNVVYDIPRSPLEAVADVSSKPQEKQINDAEEMKMEPRETENSENRPDSEQAQSPELRDNQLNALHVDLHKEKGLENLLSSSTHSSDSEPALCSEANNEIFNDNEGISSGQEEHNDTPEETEAMPESVSTSNDFLSSAEENEAAEDQNNINAFFEENIINNNEANETETSPLPSFLHLRKSPSFEFGIPLDTRSEESDQTPLLVHEKSLARRISGSAKTTMLPPEEKTIRMERSTSDISRDSSFINFLKKDAETPPDESQELALTSVKGSGKQKARSSFFSACICCSAAIH